MTTATETPRIYVASLSDYNAGRLVGDWIDIDESTDADDILAAIKDILATSPEPIAEEWAIHDYEGFGAIHLDEYESLETVAALGAAVAEHGDAFAAWVNADRYRKDHPENFTDAYLGHYESRESYAEEYAEMCGYLPDENDTNPVLRYIDWEGYARELFIAAVDDEPAPGGGIYVFDRNA